MVSREGARNIVGIIGNVISFGLFLSPVPTFYKIAKKKDVEEFKPDPYIATVLNCMFWVFYGMPFVRPDSILVVTINSIGLVLELIYLSIFFTYARNNGWSLMVGIICDIFNIIMYTSPLTIMKKVITTKSVRYMPFYLSLTNFLNGSVWTAFALIKFDVYILVSNGLGAISGAVQLILYACYFRRTPKEDEDVVKPAVQLSATNAA
ncbi:hypothetical protein FNV43_RR20002 [Rhamnella rubrinervis]|uniref:Bidirectional sugar transporter SWEET n=1 Tax=Rhamnella rubrinervis TaxID=2594499 RepID=A0A8K0DZV2_9ROSA|nr:hypothetical protein FNV43_RR20002 [Rhamnella rubrinervis]